MPPTGVDPLSMPTFRPELLNVGVGPLSGSTPATPNPTLDVTPLAEGLQWDSTTRGGMGGASFFMRQPTGKRSTRSSTNLAPNPLGTKAGVPVPGAAAEYVAMYASGGTAPGENTTPTETWDDTSGNGKDGTLSASFDHTITSGFAGSNDEDDPYRLVFDGSSDYVDCGDLSVGESRVATLELWFATTADTVRLFGEGDTGDGDMWFEANIDASGHFCGTWGNDTSYVSCDSFETYNDGEWHHGAAVIDGTHLQTYVDGAATGFQQDLPAGNATFNRVSIGCYDRGGVRTQYYAGSLACVRLYNTALTATEVAHNFAAGPFAMTENWWP